jgi:hypothetical protein
MNITERLNHIEGQVQRLAITVQNLADKQDTTSLQLNRVETSLANFHRGQRSAERVTGHLAGPTTLTGAVEKAFADYGAISTLRGNPVMVLIQREDNDVADYPNYTLWSCTPQQVIRAITSNNLEGIRWNRHGLVERVNTFNKALCEYVRCTLDQYSDQPEYIKDKEIDIGSINILLSKNPKIELMHNTGDRYQRYIPLERNASVKVLDKFTDAIEDIRNRFHAGLLKHEVKAA